MTIELNYIVSVEERIYDGLPYRKCITFSYVVCVFFSSLITLKIIRELFIIQKFYEKSISEFHFSFNKTVGLLSDTVGWMWTTSLSQITAIYTLDQGLRSNCIDVVIQNKQLQNNCRLNISQHLLYEHTPTKRKRNVYIFIADMTKKVHALDMRGQNIIQNTIRIDTWFNTLVVNILYAIVSNSICPSYSVNVKSDILFFSES